MTRPATDDTLRGFTAFKTASWGLIVTAFIHLAAHFLRHPPANDDQARLLTLFRSVRFDLGGIERTLLQVFDGFSLSLAVLLLLAGTQNLIAVRGGLSRRAVHLSSIVGVLAGAGMIGLSVTHFPMPPIVLFAGITTAFAWSAATTR